ncbi:ABC transporter permease [Gulosibacter sp. 10]|uniref:ABC transporter permease n=1 Tax=Gulosibacter sp. 10 TaxID=1255570 RepID=UPI00097EB7FE|nr:hypothetical protein [Gulosibacter sp. 10]SJM57203.1 possible ABC antibiotics transporter [Gulosibacter sp. 10]
MTALAGTGPLLRFLLRRERLRLVIWAASLGLAMLMLVYALPEIAPAQPDLAAMAALYADPVGRVLIGPGYGVEHPTYSGVLANVYGLYLLVPAALMSILLVARHTRGEEQSGRADLIRAGAVGRSSTLVSTLLLALIVNLLVAAAVTAAMLVGEPGEPGAALLFGAGLAATGMVFGGIAAIAVQLAATSGAAAGIAGAALGAAFLLRAAGDLAEPGGSALSWASPLGWAQQTAPYVLDRWWPLALSLGLAALLWAAGLALGARRDLGASLIAPRPGPRHGGAALRGPLGLGWRIQRGGIRAWTIALALTGLVFGAYAQSLLDAAADLPPEVLAMLGSDDILDGFFGVLAVFLAVLASAYAIGAVQGMRREESAGRLDPVLAAGVGRLRWYGANLLLTALAAAAMLLLGGLATGLGAWAVTDDPGLVPSLLAAHANQVPALLCALALGAALLGALPRLIGLAWLPVAYGIFAVAFAGMLELPEWAEALSPYSALAALPAEAFEPLPALALAGIAAALLAVGAWRFRRRDLG